MVERNNITEYNFSFPKNMLGVPLSTRGKLKLGWFLFEIKLSA
jgi:hypothetical protein